MRCYSELTNASEGRSSSQRRGNGKLSTSNKIWWFDVSSKWFLLIAVEPHLSATPLRNWPPRYYGHFILPHPIGGSKLANWPKGNNNLNFRFARDQVVLLETDANFISIFEFGGITKHLITCPARKSEFCFRLNLNVPFGFRLREQWRSRGNKTHCFPWRQSLSA